ncbi:phage major capsid protein [Gemmata sp.]|uniref:phage major capsid protein n=1 Tax=Gemmata sp. TaxID=1914242 RepID=UPI003F6F6B29
MNEFNDWLKANSFDPETVTEAQKPALQAAWRASLNKPAPDPTPKPAPAPGGGTASGDTLDDILEARRREDGRKQAITELAAKYLAESPVSVDTIERIGRLAIDGKWDLQKAELEMMRCSRGSGPIVYAPSQPEATAEVVEAAVCRAAGLQSIEKEFSERTLTALDRTHKRGMGLHQLIGTAARQRGWRGDSVKHDLGRAMKLAFREADDFGDRRLAVGPSTLSVSGILSNVANKMLKEAFLFVERAWREICAVRPVSDFKEVTSYSLTGDMTYDKVAPGGLLKHATLGNETYGNKADTYGKILGIDRRDMINDDLGAFAGATKRLGRGGALKINDVFWTAFLANHTTFWTAGRGNYDDGVDTAFGHAGLTAAMIIWAAKTDPDGKKLGSKPAILLVPPAHDIPAWRLMNSEFFGTTGTDGEKNPWARKFKQVTSEYLNDSNMGGGYSALAWYLLANPQDLPVIEMCFLDGQEMPTVESVEMDADRLGMALRAWHDFGARQQEYRGGLKLKGEA